VENIRELYQAGTNVMRLNFSHDTGDAQGVKIDRARMPGHPIAVLADLQGPKHRIGDFSDTSKWENGLAALVPGDKFIVDNNPARGDNTRVYLPEDEVRAALKSGDKILLNDGKQELKVTAASPERVETVVVRGGEIKGRRGFNLPDTEIDSSVLTDKDRADLEYALTKSIDYVALSFVQRPEDVTEAREFISARTDRPIKIVVKLERPQAVAKLDEIIKLADAVMIARGDLAVEVPFAAVPSIARKTIRLCRAAHKPVIVATQMLSSMEHGEFPTRAEVSDVASAAYLHADSTMTSEETSVGDHPILTTRTMADILEYADMDDAGHAEYAPVAGDEAEKKIIADADMAKANAIVVFTETGDEARALASNNTRFPIIAVTKEPICANQLCLSRAVFPICDEKIFDSRDAAAAARHFAIGGPVAVAGPDGIKIA
jgi:pyruvate kinase